MQEDHHRTWGFVVYRTTYDSDADWAEFPRRLRVDMEYDFDFCNGRDILDKFTPTILEDRSLFEGASTDTFRRHFQRWSLTAYPTEQQQPQESSESESGRSFVDIGYSPRYRYALEVDAEALHSLVHVSLAPPDFDKKKLSWVKLIDRSWYLGRGESTSDPLEPIEGMIVEDVGSAKVSYQSVMTT
ncbi:MAG: hypothetical protein M1818_003600 [Claussenomyces sp. TS43310]|nr:MAG: hypothetical protein M1818_003600 [Claussenomyces sp. TS43310]